MAQQGYQDVIVWRVYYDDGSFSENEIINPFRVIAVVQPSERTGREVLSAWPYYLLRKGRWVPAEDVPSLVQQVIYFAKDIEAVCMGIWAEDQMFQDILNAATNDPGLPRRSSKNWHPRR